MIAHLSAGPAGRLLVSGLAAALVACSGATPQDLQLGQQQQQINDGDPEPGEPAVMMVFHQSGSMCTGTLIGKRVVLTAKHCVMRDTGALLSAWGFQLAVGPSMWQIAHTYGVVEVRATPGIATEDSDMGLLILDTDAAETPYPYLVEMDTDIAGRDALLIGYGVDHCPGDNSGTKLRTIDTIMGWYSMNDFWTQGRGANQGDSGGPVFDPATMTVMGVMSRGSFDVCDGFTVVVATAPWKTFINQALEDTGDCAPTTVEDICYDNIDNDCDGVVDDGCALSGTPCEDDTECASRFCRDVGAGPICTDPCEPGADGACPVGSVCLLLSCAEGACAPGTPGTKRVGEACGAHMECEDILCRDPGTGTPICMAPCELDLGQCLATEACIPIEVGGSCGGCAPDSLHAGPWHLGERCVLNFDCVSGNCFDDGGLSYCTQACDANQLPCPEGFHCRESRCVRGTLGLLAGPCLTDEDCASDLACFGGDPAAQNPGYCTAICTGGGTCPTGSSCAGSVCVVQAFPLGQACDSGPDCLSQGCFPFGGESSCTATCDRREACPPLLACVVSDNGMTLCQPHGDPLVEGPPDPEPQPTPKDKCSTGTAGGLGLPLLLMLLFVLVRRRRGSV
jgi:MYXO-CTERM domain-containing protein